MRGHEASETFPCFGSTCAAVVSGRGALGAPEAGVATVKRRLLAWHNQFSRFERDSELSRLNADGRGRVPASAAMLVFVLAAVKAAADTGGLVDATLINELEDAGYTQHHHDVVALEVALELAPARKPAGPSAAARWREIRAGQGDHAVTRPPGVKLDSGGLAKGLFADILAKSLATHASFAIDCAGDLRIGGGARAPRPILVASPFDERIIHRFELVDAGIATSGIGKRSWLGADGLPAHHLLDPATGKPAYTGIVQVTALAPTGLIAEIRAKAALLSGPAGARAWLPDGGVIVFDDGSHDVVREALSSEPPARAGTARGVQGFRRAAQRRPTRFPASSHP